MKDLIVITAHCPTEEQEKILEKCVDSIIKLNYHICLVSHTHIPLHIQKKCNYYFYDYLNDTSDDYDLLSYEYYKFGDGSTIQSKFFQKYFYGYAIYRMVSIASQIAINFGYENYHHVEYDCEILDRSLIEKNSDLLNVYDSIIYTHNGQHDGFLFGSFKSFKVKSLPDKFKNYDKQFITEKIIAAEKKYLEYLTKDIFLNSGKFLIKNQNELTEDKFLSGKKFYNRNLHYTLYYNPYDKNLNLFYRGFHNVNEKICVLVNNKNVIMKDIKPNFWSVIPLGIFDEINNVRIDNSEKILYEIKFDNKFRETFKRISYFKNAENN